MLVDSDVLIDAGTGLGDLDLNEVRLIRHVFLTHAHLDHIAGLPLLVDAIFSESLEQPLTVYGRRETIDALQSHIFNWVIWPDFAELPTAEKPVLRYHECNPGDTITIGHRDFHAINVEHTVPSIGFTVENSSGVFAVSGDTKTNQTLWPVLNASANLKALVIEVSFPDERAELADIAGHYCPRTLTRDLEKLKHDPDIWLTGMKPGDEVAIFREVREQMPGRCIRMLSSGVTITV
ncbi:MAG: 3',5'-cyclic-nucleotide phosphodiesterase [Woeseia sp.]